MLRRRTQYRRKTDAIPDAFPQRQHASGLPWAEIARRLGVAPLTIRRWRYKGVRPNYQHLKALHDLAEDLGLAYIFTD